MSTVEAMSDLVIIRLSHTTGSPKGGQDMILLCEKVVKGRPSVFVLHLNLILEY